MVQLLYLLDSSSVISVHDTYYSCDRVPEFWEWLEFQSRKGVYKIPPSVFSEIKPTEFLASQTGGFFKKLHIFFNS